MYLFFEEDGTFKAGKILKQEGNSYQVELTTGRRTKVKGGHVFFEFERPDATSFLEQAKEEAQSIDVQFLWEVAGTDEVGYDSVASEYYGDNLPIHRAAVIFALHANPVYFYRKGRGRYKPAPEETLKRALEAVARKAELERQRQQMCHELMAGKVPEAITNQVYNLLLAGDKNSIEWKALNDAAAESRMSPLRLMLKLGAIENPWRWHVESFFRQNFPKGRGFAKDLPLPPAIPEDLPLANVRSFSIDDEDTTEIDDAASVTPINDKKTRIGVHIAAPALFIDRESPLEAVAVGRMSTVYAPGMKTTMLPKDWVEATSLDEGKVVPCVSLYITVDNETMAVEGTDTRLEKIAVTENLRYERFHEKVTEEAILSNTLDIPWADEIGFLWRFAKARLADRLAVSGRSDTGNHVDWYIKLDGDCENDFEHVHIIRKGRVRGAPVDLLVAELMIFANSTWGLWLEEHHVAGIYRGQRMGRVRMSTSPSPHDGLGVFRYAWSSSPLRRYVDLFNQRQIIATVRGESAPFMANEADLHERVARFEALHDIYGDFQRKMERFWSLRWIEQEGLKEVEAIVVKEELVRLDGLPFVQRIPGLPLLERGHKVKLAVTGFDYVDVLLETRFLQVLDATAELDDQDLEETDLNADDIPSDSLDEDSVKEQTEIEGNA